jgi:hypothetical protein
MLVMNIAARQFDGLVTPLAYGQIAPGPSDSWWTCERQRVGSSGLPLLAGCALCVALLVVGRRILRPDEVLVALVLTACSPVLVRYSAEVKPYSRR